VSGPAWLMFQPLSSRRASRYSRGSGLAIRRARFWHARALRKLGVRGSF
jgi:hypothetical protein